MNSVTIALILIAVVLAGIIFYRKKLSAQAILEKAFKDAKDSVNTDEEIFWRMVQCIVINGNEFSSLEEIEEDLKQKDNTLSNLEEKGFSNDLYKNLNEVEKKIYLVINGYDLKLFPDYLITKAINIVEKRS